MVHEVDWSYTNDIINALQSFAQDALQNFTRTLVWATFVGCIIYHSYNENKKGRTPARKYNPQRGDKVEKGEPEGWLQSMQSKYQQIEKFIMGIYLTRESLLLTTTYFLSCFVYSIMVCRFIQSNSLMSVINMFYLALFFLLMLGPEKAFKTFLIAMIMSIGVVAIRYQWEGLFMFASVYLIVENQQKIQQRQKSKQSKDKKVKKDQKSLKKDEQDSLNKSLFQLKSFVIVFCAGEAILASYYGGELWAPDSPIFLVLIFMPVAVLSARLILFDQIKTKNELKQIKYRIINFAGLLGFLWVQFLTSGLVWYCINLSITLTNLSYEALKTSMIERKIQTWLRIIISSKPKDKNQKIERKKNNNEEQKDISDGYQYLVAKVIRFVVFLIIDSFILIDFSIFL